MVDSDSPPAFSPSSSLLCQEAQDKQNEETEEEEDVYEFGYKSDKERDEDDAFVQILLHRELSSSSSNPHQMINDWIKRARVDSIQWIFNTRELFQFQLQTAYLSVTYFDLFLSRRIIDSGKYWAVRLLSVACLSLAAKMEECRVPSLSDFLMEDYNFEGKDIQRMELLVLNTLEWKMGLITPFDYLHNFISKCDQSPPKNLLPRIIDLIFALTKDINSISYRPSVIAAAATLLALDQKLTRQCIEFKINTFSCGILQIEDVFSCYNRMQELDKEKIKLPESILSPNLSPVQLKGADFFGSSSVTSAVSTKRKRLKFNDYDQNYGMPDEKRRR